jgi:ribosome-associated toxin RatA of RatAB toxin-antitoxin module
MPLVERSVLLPYSAAQLLALVEDVRSYPAFLSGCTEATVLNQAGDATQAQLSFKWLGMTERFSTCNTRVRDADGNQGLAMQLLEGPFRKLSGQWAFQPLGESGCKVSLRVEVDLGAKAFQNLFSSKIDQVVSGVMQAFRQRAAALYGATG